MSIAFIIQARSGSTRLPNKVLIPFYGDKTILDIQLTLLKNNFSQMPVIIATTTSKADDAITDKYTTDKGVKIFRGDEHNVLKRFVGAAMANEVFHIIRICADNPFLSSTHLHKMIDEYAHTKPDYCSYRFKNGTPAIRSHCGLFAEAVSLATLIKIQQLAVEPIYYEHVTNYIYTHKDKFNLHFLPVPAALNNYTETLRLTVDTLEDFNQLQELYSNVISKYGQNYTLENLLAEIDSDVPLQKGMQNRIEQHAK